MITGLVDMLMFVGIAFYVGALYVSGSEPRKHLTRVPATLSSSKMPTVIILGGGIIALSTAYYASLSSSEEIHIIESNSTFFECASGRAAGFLARDWFSSSVAGLGELSFVLHQRLAEEHDGATSWGYSGSTGISTSQSGSKTRGEDWLFEGTTRAQAASSLAIQATNAGPAWLASSACSGQAEIISNPNTTAQVDPLRLCQFLLKQCIARGVVFHRPAKATRVKSDNGILTGVYITESGTEKLVLCQKILIACGVWSPIAFNELFPSASISLLITSLAGHSLILRSPRWKPEDIGDCHAIFTTTPDGWSPELFSRRGGELYLAGLNSSIIPIPKLASETVVQGDDIEAMIKTARILLGNDVEVVRTGMCHRPVTSTGMPILGKIPSVHIGLEGIDGPGGIYVASGHGAWGISLSLGTGKVMAEMMAGDKTSIDVSLLGP